jgi:hypothetical protein
MKTKRYVTALAVLGALGVMAVLVGTRARAQDVPPMVATGQFGMVGAVQGETARLTVSNINLLPPDQCRAALAFVDASGELLRRPDGTLVRKEVMLEAGHSASLQVNAGALLGRDERRLDLRPVLFVAPSDPSTPSDPCVASVEIIQNATGRTRLVVPGSVRMYSANHNETLVEDR